VSLKYCRVAGGRSMASCSPRPCRVLKKNIFKKEIFVLLTFFFGSCLINRQASLLHQLTESDLRVVVLETP
jgi:hypothetical protein